MHIRVNDFILLLMLQ